MKLVVGLGNPGEKYRSTLHNAGFIVLDELCQRFGIDWSGSKFQSEFASGSVRGERCVFLKPQTYMNLSGRAVQQALAFYKVACEDLIVLHDDIDVPVKKVKSRIGGGAGGHNGIRSIKQETGCEKFHRIKLGVGRPTDKRPVESWVLGSLGEELMSALSAEMADEAELRINELIK